MVLSNPIFSSTGRVIRFLIPVVKRKNRKGEARGSPSLERLCPGSGNLSLASSGRLVLACALLQVVILPVLLVFSTVLES